jgi:hypothetical protein
VSELVTLTKPQTEMLIYVRWIGTSGHRAPPRHPVLAALGRRGMVAYHGSRATPRIEAWHATAAGQKWVDDRSAAARAMPDG